MVGRNQLHQIMRATFVDKPSSRSNTNKATKQNRLRDKKARRKLEQFRNTFYQVVCEYSPDALGNEEDFLEYLAEQVWEEGALQQLDSATVTVGEECISDDKIRDKIFDVVKQDFITFGICESDQECLEMCQAIIKKWKKVVDPTSITEDDGEEDDEAAEEKELEEGEEEYEPGTCELCHRHMPLTFHHLIPRHTHKKVLKRNLFTKEEVLTRGALLCRPCHSACHRMISLDDMALTYNTVEKLVEHEGVNKYVGWACKQKEYNSDHTTRKLRYRK